MGFKEELDQLDKKKYGIGLVALGVISFWLTDYTFILLILLAGPGAYLLWLDKQGKR